MSLAPGPPPFRWTIAGPSEAQVRHDYSAVTGESGAVIGICERAAAAVQSPPTTLAASAWSSVAAQLANKFSALWDGKPGSAACAAFARPASADSFIVVVQDEGAYDGVIEALIPVLWKRTCYTQMVEAEGSLI